jgi:hypothetical protein
MGSAGTLGYHAIDHPLGARVEVEQRVELAQIEHVLLQLGIALQQLVELRELGIGDTTVH